MSLVELAVRNGRLLSKEVDVQSTLEVATAAFIEFASLGFRTRVEELVALTDVDLERSLEAARSIVGADRDMEPVYPGFPTQVQELSTMTLLVEQILHYWTSGSFLPNYPKELRPGLPLKDMTRSTRQLTVVTFEEFVSESIDRLSRDPVSFSAIDKELVRNLFDTKLTGFDLENVENFLKVSRNRENGQWVVRSFVSGLSKEAKNEVFDHLVSKVNSLDELLRLVLAVYAKPSSANVDSFERAVNLSDSDAWAFKMESMPKHSRRSLVASMGALSAGFDADQLVSHRNIWRRVMRSVHPFSLSGTGADSKRALDIVHGNVQHSTRNALVEKALTDKDVALALDLLEGQTGNILRRLVAFVRLAEETGDLRSIDRLCGKVEKDGGRTPLTTLVSAYNGVLCANDEVARIVRVAGRNNKIIEKDTRKVSIKAQSKVLGALREAIVVALSSKDAPEGVVGVDSIVPVPLVRRDLSANDVSVDRGERFRVIGEGDTLRVFGNWRNNMDEEGYMDVAAVILDEGFDIVSVCSWDGWGSSRDWATYSGDTLVYPGGTATEYIDVNLGVITEKKLGRYVAFTIHSWSGFPIDQVDMIAGAMLRSKADAGEVFDPRTVTTAFKPLTKSLQCVPFVVDLESNELIWIDSSNGSVSHSKSALHDDSIGQIVRDEIGRERLTFGQLATLWAKAHGAQVDVDAPVDTTAVKNLFDR